MRDRLHALAVSLEGALPAAGLAAMVAIPLLEIVARTRNAALPGAAAIVQHLTLWVGFLGAAIAAREGKLLSLATGAFLPAGQARRFATAFAAAVAAGVSALLARAGLELVKVEREYPTEAFLGVPTWVAQLVLPISFALIAVRLAWKAGDDWAARAIGAAGLALGLFAGQRPELLEGGPLWPWLLLVVAATALGAPIFATLGGFAVLLFLGDGTPMAAVPVETYRLCVNPTLPAIPLFTLTGFLLAEGKASERLVAVFRALFGAVPGGTAVVATLVCAFFTVFTGGSGVTILALGGLLYKALQADGYRDRFSVGLLTSAGSLGLLLPPALPLILYGIVAQVPIENLFLGGLIPGLLLVSVMAGWGVREGMRTGAGRATFDRRVALRALWVAKWELLLPVAVIGAMFSGKATPVEASAFGALWALVVQVFVHRDLGLKRAFGVLRECAVLVGGVLIILGVAMGLTNWLVDAQVPAVMLAWVGQHVDSQIVFLLGLNLFLLVVGCLMDIFSATVVVVPLIVPLGLAFGVDPVHLGIIFIANLELGYLTPPVGLNLFLASYRFEKPLLEVYRATVPPLLLRAVGVGLVTYLPFLTTTLPRLFGH